MRLYYREHDLGNPKSHVPLFFANLSDVSDCVQEEELLGKLDLEKRYKNLSVL